MRRILCVTCIVGNVEEGDILFSQSHNYGMVILLLGL